MTVNLSCFAGVGQQFFDNTGVPLAGGLIYSYLAGTTTPVATYTTSAGTIAHTNPIVLDSAGRVPSGEIWVDPNQTYKYVVKKSDGTLLNTYDNIPSIVTAIEITSAILTPIMFGAIGNGVADDTTAMYAMFDAADGRTCDGLGKSYKVTPNIVLDPYATLGVGYGPGKLWFVIYDANIIQNMTIIGSTSFGNNFWGKQLSANSVKITGDCRISSWYTTYNGLLVTGTTWLGGDLPPTNNFTGFFYNTFTACDFNRVICDQRYGPVNLNNFTECQFQSWLVTDTGTVGYTAIPFKDFHLNTFIGCEWFTNVGEGIIAPDGSEYCVVYQPSANIGGINRYIAVYMETPVRGFYGRGIEIDNLHTSGQGIVNGGGFVGFVAPLSGEAGMVDRDVPHIYPAGSISTGGDWSILNDQGIPFCLSSNNMTVGVGNDFGEPTGLGKYASFDSTAAFASVSINFGNNGTTNNPLRSFAIVYKLISGNPPQWETTGVSGSSAFGSVGVTNLGFNWFCVYGHTYGIARMISATAYRVHVSAVSTGRGAGVMSPFANQANSTTPLLDFSGGASLVKNFLNDSSLGAYSNQSAKTMNAAGGNYDFFAINLGTFSGNSINLRVNFSLISATGGARQWYRESIIQADAAGTLAETNIHAINGLNGSLSFVLSGATITIRAATSVASDESGKMAINAFGYDMSTAFVTIL